MRFVSRISASAMACAAGFAAAPGWACPACFAASSSGTRLGYYVSTAILSVTPLLIMGLGVGYVAFKRSQAERAARDAVEPR
jgi:hypothetical protein